MKKVNLVLLILLFLFTGCKNIPKKAWTNPVKSEIVLDLQAGDIIIKEKELNLFGVFGHVGIMKNERLIVDYPKFGKKIVVTDIGYWLEMNRKFMILRYKRMSEEFKKRLILNINYYITLAKPYEITFNKIRDDGFYCSQFIWYLYYKTAKELGVVLNLTPNAGAIVFPYDFIFSKELYIVN